MKRVLHTFISKRAIAMLTVSVLALASAAAASTAMPRKYAGKTSQGQPIRIKVARNGRSATVTTTAIDFCPTLQVGFRHTDPDKVKLSRTRKYKLPWSFNADLPDDPSIGQGDLTGKVTGVESGKLGRSAATGRYHEHLTIIDGSGQTVGECDTGAVTFKAPAKR